MYIAIYVEVAIGKVNATIPEGNKIVIDTTTIPYSIKEYTANGALVRDLYNLSDFSTKRFMYLEFGNNRISIGDDSSNKVTTEAEGIIYYASV